MVYLVLFLWLIVITITTVSRNLGSAGVTGDVKPGGTVRRQRFLPVRVWLVVGLDISPSYVDAESGPLFLCLGQGASTLINNAHGTIYNRIKKFKKVIK